MQMKPQQQNRRQLIKLAGAAAASLIGVNQAKAARRNIPSSLIHVSSAPSSKPQFELGLASYTLRKFDLDQTIEMTKKVGLKYVCFKSFHLPLDSNTQKISEVVKKVKDAGLILYGGGVISMKNQAQVDNAFQYAKAAGMKVIVGSPTPQMLELIDKKVKQYDIKVAIHNHGPGDKTWPTPDHAYDKVEKFDKRIGFCHDIGHTQRLGIDPVISTLKVADRLHDVHIKDVTGSTAKDHGCEIGRGVIDIPGFLRVLLKIKYKGIVSFEYEKDADDPLAGLAESVGYVKGALAAVSRPSAADVFLAP